VTRLMCFIPNPTDATSLYRAAGPLETLARARRDLDLVVNPPEVNWRSLKGVDAVFMQRCMLDHHVKVADMAVSNGKRLWVDYDDDLYCVPAWNPTFKIYGKAQTQNNVTAILAKADVVTVSTPVLQAKVREILEALRAASAADPQRADPTHRLSPGKVVVVPNAYDTELLAPLKGEPLAPRNPLVMWRGSATHDKDLLVHAAGLARVIGRHLDWTYNFVGDPFWLAMEQIEAVPGLKPTSIIRTESLDPINFFAFLRATRPSLMIVPLEDNPFNRAKSNIAWVEGTHAGAVTLAPDWDEWRRPGVITYKDAGDFEEKMDRFLSGGYDHARLWVESRDFIAENLALPRVNQLRDVLLRDLSDGGRNR
jgi:glycosyltransferase involved in cell wall biosynthesis